MALGGWIGFLLIILPYELQLFLIGLTVMAIFPLVILVHLWRKLQIRHLFLTDQTTELFKGLTALYLHLSEGESNAISTSQE